MTEKFKKDELVWAWDYDEDNAVRQFFLGMVPHELGRYAVYSDTGCVSQWKNCSRVKPSAVQAPADNKRVIVRSNALIECRRYSTGELDENGHLLCYENGCDGWTSDGGTMAWPHWRLADEEG